MLPSTKLIANTGRVLYKVYPGLYNCAYYKTNIARVHNPGPFTHTPRSAYMKRYEDLDEVRTTYHYFSSGGVEGGTLLVAVDRRYIRR